MAFDAHQRLYDGRRHDNTLLPFGMDTPLMLSASAGTASPSIEDSDGKQSSALSLKPHKRIPTESWEAKRPIITKLYQEERKSLKEVMEILQRDHGFKATYIPPPPK